MHSTQISTRVFTPYSTMLGYSLAAGPIRHNKLTRMIATITAYDKDGAVSHHDTWDYSDLSLLWEHIGCQQNNRRTIRVHVETETGLEYEVLLSPWTPSRRYLPSPRFHALLRTWANE